MEFFAQYAGFLLRTVTVVVAIIVVLVVIAALRSKGRGQSHGQLQVRKLNEVYQNLRERLEQAVLDNLVDMLEYLEDVQNVYHNVG